MKKLLYRIPLVILILVALNWLYARFFYEKDLRQHSEIIELPRKAAADSCEIIYLGESSNKTFSWDDADRRKISDFVWDCFPGVRCGDLTKEASHAEVYYYMLKNIPEDSQVKTVVVTMNMRSFNSGWIYSELETPIQKYLVLMKDYPPLMKRFLLAFKAYPIKSAKEWSNLSRKHLYNDALDFPYDFPYGNAHDWDVARSLQGCNDENGVYSQALTELACHYVKTYAFTIKDDNPRLKDFDNIVKLAQDRGWNLVFNLMAENVDRANELVGEDLIFLIKRNRDYLVDRYGSLDNVQLVDNISSVRDSLYTDRNWTTEHYMEYGRKTIAQNVARALQQYYPEQYQPIADFPTIQGAFRNECEKGPKAFWQGDYTFTDERSWSGKYSSKVCGEKPFSLTLEVPGHMLPESNKAYVSAQVFQTDTLHEAQLAVQLDYTDAPTKLEYHLLRPHLCSDKRWDFFTFTIPVDSAWYVAERVKFYIYNPTESPVFVDDFDVSFQR